jgi:phage-related protein
MKPIVFLASSLSDLRDFPADARREAGHQLDRVQRGEEPDDWKPMLTIGPGVREIRVRDEGGAWRVVYLATLPAAIYVLHAFQKKTQRTAARDLAVASSRLRALRAQIS